MHTAVILTSILQIGKWNSGKLRNLTKDTGLMSGRCGIQIQVEESSILAHTHKVIYLH